jgi:glycosyltransferase involved in cell wall biosynthesis
VKPGLVSTILPVYNRAGLMREAAMSVLRQEYPEIELIVVDDGSTDETALAAQALTGEHPERVRVLRQENAGPGAARRLGLGIAQGEFIQYLDSDDLLAPGKFEQQVAALRANPGAGVAYGLTIRIDVSSGHSRAWARTGEDIGDIFPSFLMGRGWDTNSPLWRRDVCDAIGAWSDLRCLEDWEHDLRAGLIGVRPVRVDAHVATVRDHAHARASGMNSGYTPELIKDMFSAHRNIWFRMREQRRCDWSYLRGFSRKMFWIARMCGERGLEPEADEALDLAQEMMATRGSTIGVRAFRLFSRSVGWPAAVAAGENLRRLIGRDPGSAS